MSGNPIRTMTLDQSPRGLQGDMSEAFIAERYRNVRDMSLSLCSGLSDADASAQSMPDASPAKWHLAHTTWFFETFLLRHQISRYRLFDDRWPFLFNSYYEAEGARLPRSERGLLSRPSLREIQAYRAHVDAAILESLPYILESHGELLELGLQHEQQHQELMLTDIKHLFFRNPLGPAYGPVAVSSSAPEPLRWTTGTQGLAETGAISSIFAFDNELPRHSTWLNPHAIANRPVVNSEWLEFLSDDAYAKPSLWLADGWDWVQREGIEAPLYWRKREGEWENFTLAGWKPIDLAAPVCHISFYEADAFAAWSGSRLPTEQEWEAAASQGDPADGIQMDRGGAASPRTEPENGAIISLFGNVWEWTGSAYRPYPGFQAAPGAVGEYNGKFMSGQFVLKGGSCASPRGHVRASYRNFFHPHQRWQFSGLRLARSL